MGRAFLRKLCRLYIDHLVCLCYTLIKQTCKSTILHERRNPSLSKEDPETQSILADIPPAEAIVKLAIPATLALLAKAVYKLVDTADIGLLNSDIALTAVGVTVPLLLIMVSVENIFAAGAAVLAGRQLGAKEPDAASRAALREEANTAIAAMLEEKAADTLDKVLFELSSQMKNAYSRSDA